MTAPPPETVVVYEQPTSRGSGVGYFILGFVTCGLLVLILASRPGLAADDIGNKPVVVQLTTPAQPQKGTNTRHASVTKPNPGVVCATQAYVDQYVQQPPGC